MSYPDREVLEAFVQGDLPLIERIRLRSHLRKCMPCALRVADLRWAASEPRPEDTNPELLVTRGCEPKKFSWEGGRPQGVLMPAMA